MVSKILKIRGGVYNRVTRWNTDPGVNYVSTRYLEYKNAYLNYEDSSTETGLQCPATFRSYRSVLQMFAIYQ